MEDSALEPLELPDPPKDLADRWHTEVLPRIQSPKIKAALLHYLSGDGYLTAGRKAGISPQAVSQAAERYKLAGLGARDTAIVSQQRQIAHASGSAILERLHDPERTDSLSMKELSIVNGIATDKLIRREQIQRDSGAGGLSGLDRLAAALADGNLKLELTVQPAEPDAIDVTPHEQNETTGKP